MIMQSVVSLDYRSHLGYTTNPQISFTCGPLNISDILQLGICSAAKQQKDYCKGIYSGTDPRSHTTELPELISP